MVSGWNLNILPVREVGEFRSVVISGSVVVLRRYWSLSKLISLVLSKESRE